MVRFPFRSFLCSFLCPVLVVLIIFPKFRVQRSANRIATSEFGGEDESNRYCKTFHDSRRFIWLTKPECSKHKYCDESEDDRFIDAEGKEGRDKMKFTGKDCSVRSLSASDFSACYLSRELNIVNIGGSVARAHFVSLCRLLQDPITFTDEQKHKPSFCKSKSGINIYHMFLPGIYTTPKQTKSDFEKSQAKRRCKLHRIWDKVVPYNETALVKLQRMLEGKYSPWYNFDIRKADIIFWSSGVWDVAFKQDLIEYRQNLLKVASYLQSLSNAKIVFRTIPRFNANSRAKECDWKKTAGLVPSYNEVTIFVQQKYGFDLIDAENIPRDDEIYDGIHFARSLVSAGLTGECDRAVSTIFANYIYLHLKC